MKEIGTIRLREESKIPLKYWQGLFFSLILYYAFLIVWVVFIK